MSAFVAVDPIGHAAPVNYTGATPSDIHTHSTSARGACSSKGGFSAAKLPRRALPLRRWPWLGHVEGFSHRRPVPPLPFASCARCCGAWGVRIRRADPSLRKGRGDMGWAVATKRGHVGCGLWRHVRSVVINHSTRKGLIFSSALIGRARWAGGCTRRLPSVALRSHPACYRRALRLGPAGWPVSAHRRPAGSDVRRGPLASPGPCPLGRASECQSGENQICRQPPRAPTPLARFSAPTPVCPGTPPIRDMPKPGLLGKPTPSPGPRNRELPLAVATKPCQWHRLTS